jgi:pimeloyl-ACP methyl ester carboxylesterase/class 3 adenylate cyclase
MEVETRYAKSGDLRIAYQVHGHGPIDLLFAPGYLSHLEQNQWWPEYAEFIRKCASFSRLIVFDRRGTGLSDRILSLGSFEELMDDIGAVLDAVRSERAALFGGAEGGPMCALYAATFPERTSALVLGASYARRTWAPDYPWGLDADAQRRILDGYEDRWGRPGFGSRSLAPSLVGDKRFQDWYAQAQRFAGTPASARTWFEVTMEIDVRGILPAIRVPTLVIHRTGDRVIPVESGRYLAEHIPDARYVEVPGDDHLPFVGNIDSIVDEIEEFLTGSRRAREPDRVLATVLFTDIVASTERASALGDREWRRLLDRHDALARRVVERYEGKLVKSTGDGLLATFDGPARGIRAACELVAAAGALDLALRAGLHTGEVERRGDDVAGIAVHIGSRVGALARPDEVLVSRTVKDLVAGSGIAFESRGDFELKGVADRWELLRVVDSVDAS